MSDDYIDSGWSIQNDLLSVTVGINNRLWIISQQGKIPTLIRLGKLHSQLFWKEKGVPFIPNGPTQLISGDLLWDEELKCWRYGTAKTPMRFNDSKIYGIAVEGVPKPPKEKKKKKST